MKKLPIIWGIILVLLLSSISSTVIGFNAEKVDMSIQSVDGPMDSPWPMKCHDVKRTGCSKYIAEGNQGILKWKFNIGSHISSSPAIDNHGIIYIGGSVEDESIYAVNLDGSEKWRFETNGHIQSSPAIATDNTIYVGSNDAGLYAINPDGTLKWRTGLGSGWVYSSPLIDDNGIIYASSVGSGRLCALYPNNGTIIWMYQAEDNIYCSPSLDNEGNIYIGSNDGYMYSIYPNGTLRWRFYAGGSKGIGSTPSIGVDGIIYFGATSGYLYALYPNGTLKWKYQTGYIGDSSPAISKDGTIYIGSNNGKIFSFNYDGTLNWEFLTEEDISSSPMIDDNGVIYIGSWDGYFYSINPDGNLRWKFKTGSSIFSSSSISENGTIYFGSWDGYLYALETIYNPSPSTPTINGPSSGKAGVEYNYTIVSIDPDGDNITYSLDWGLGLLLAYGPYESGEEVTLNHTWNERGDYIILVKAKDPYGAESELATLEVSMPRIKLYNNYLFPILRLLLKYSKL